MKCEFSWDTFLYPVLGFLEFGYIE